MAERSMWRGHLRLALVSCPVALYAARHDRANLHFHLINPDTGHRVRMVTQDAETDEPVERRKLVRGYEFKKDTYLILEDEDFDSARIDSSSTLSIDKFVDADSIDPIYFDASYYLAPDGRTGADVFAVLRDAIEATGRLALARLVIARRERAVAIKPLGRGLVVHTLHEERDLNDWHRLFDEIPAGPVDGDMVKLATQLIDRQTGTYDPADMEDRFEARLREVIEAKLQGEGITPEAEEEDEESNVIDLMAALRGSLDRIGAKARPKSQSKSVAKTTTKAKTKAKTGPAPKKAAAGSRKAAGRH